MGREVLVLNCDYEPLNVCNMRRAVILVYKGKADVLHTAADEDEPHALYAPSQAAGPPSVVKLRSQIRRPMPELKVSRRSVFARDNYTCQYCGVHGKDMTIDHVRPRRHGGDMSWENLVTCCKRCNTRKADKFLEKSGMRLIRAPKRPRYTPYIGITQYVASSKNQLWRNYLPACLDLMGTEQSKILA